MKTTTAIGRTVEEAIKAGLLEMGIPADRVSVEILEEPAKGFLGFGGRQARVKLTEKPDASASTPAAPVATPDKPPVLVKTAAEESPAAEKPRPRAGKAAEGTPEQRAEGFLTGLFEQIGFKGGLTTTRDEEQLTVVIEGEDTSMFVGHHGETLDALQYLTSLHVNKGAVDYVRVHVDTAGYREKRAETLTRLAERTADKAVKTNRRVALEPMNSYERRILHSALQDYPGVTTFSEGEEPMRRVVIAPKR